MTMTLEEARDSRALLFECVAGSRAYGTSHANSDTDLRGVFVMPRPILFGLSSVEQVSDAKNDETYYELGRFIELLAANNPNILELLFTPDDCVRVRDPLMDLIKPESVLSKRCEASFAGYAMTQIRRARGLNKKIVNPMEGPRRPAVSFCHVVEGQGSVPLEEWLQSKGLERARCGIVDVPKMRDVHAIFYDPDGTRGYSGVFRDSDSTEIAFSSVERDAKPIGWMQFNRDAFKKYCREYSDYQHWLANRNEDRYATNVEHGRNYDSKNLMHTFRLLSMAEEIATEGLIRVRRPDAEQLLRIRSGEFEYEDLIARAEAKVVRIGALFESSGLPDAPDRDALEQVLIEMREAFYGRE